MRWVLRGLLLILFALSVVVPAAAFSLLQPDTWPQPFNPSKWPAPFNPSGWPFTLIPVPEIATDPNGGTTYGVLLACLFEDQQGQIQHIFPPDFNNNTD